MAVPGDHRAEGKPFHVEYRVKRATGEIVWLEVTGTLIVDHKNKPVRLFGTTIDITERKNAEEVLKSAIKTAQSATRAKSDFLTNMSHEIRTPLCAIMGFTELVSKPSTSLSELKSYVQVINRNSQHLLRIVDDILDLSKVEAGQMLSEVIEVSLPNFLQDLYALMKLKTKGKQVEFRVVISSPLPKKIMSDPTRLKQILMNVLSNALKFTEKGFIELHIALTKGNILNFTVKDTGCGISESQQKQIFRPFVQGDASTSRKYGGTGLGLVLT
jgi:signal transduction histidine kinase